MKRIDKDFLKKDFSGFDDIKASPELKKKIFDGIREKRPEKDNMVVYRKKNSFLRWIASAAALIILFCSILVWGVFQPGGHSPKDTIPNTDTAASTPGNQLNEEAKKIVIWWNSDTFSKQFIHSVVSDFRQEYPMYNDVEIEIQYPTVMDPSLLKLNLEEGTAPDIVMMEHIHLAQLRFEKLVENLAAPEYGASELQKKYVPSAWKAVSLGSEIFALPFDCNTMTMVYNMEILNKVGMNIPTNYEEITELWERVADLEGEYYGYSMNLDFFPVWPNNNHLVLFYNLGGSLVSEYMSHTNTAINTPNSLIALERMKEIASRKGVSMSATEANFAQGKIAMMELGDWWGRLIMQDDRWATAPMPQFMEGKPPLSIMGCRGLAIVSKPQGDKLSQADYEFKHKVAYEFIKFLSATPKYQHDYNVGLDRIPSLQEVHFMAPFNEGVYKVYVDQMKNTVPIPNVYRWPEIVETFKQLLADIFNGKDIHAAAADAEIKINLLLSDYPR